MSLTDEEDPYGDNMYDETADLFSHWIMDCKHNVELQALVFKEWNGENGQRRG